MTIVTRGYGGHAIVTWGYGDLVVELLHPKSGVEAEFGKLNGILIIYNAFDLIATEFDRIIAETSEDPVVIPPGDDLQVIPTVSISFESDNRISVNYASIDTVDAFMNRVVSEEPIVQVKPPQGGDLQVIPTISVDFGISDGVRANHEISDKVGTTFIRIVAEEN